MTKTLITAIYAFCSIAALVIIGLSIGVYIPIFSIVLIPTIITQVYAGIRSYRYHPAFVSWILLSGFTFLAFSLFRPDADPHGQFSGYGVLLFHLGLSDTEHIEPWTYSLEVSLVLLLALIFINAYILRRAVVISDK